MLSEKDNKRVEEAIAEEYRKRKFSYFVKYDEISGVAPCPGRILQSKKYSCFDENYKEKILLRLGTDITIGDTSFEDIQAREKQKKLCKKR